MATANNAGPTGMERAFDAQKATIEGRCKMVAKDSPNLALMQGMFTPVMFEYIADNAMPVVSDILRNSRSVLKQAMHDCCPPQAPLLLFLTGMLDTNAGVPRPTYTSFAVVFALRLERSLSCWVETATRTCTAAQALLGVEPHLALTRLFAIVLQAVQPTHLGSHETLLSFTDAEDVINDAIQRVVHCHIIRGHTQAERWQCVVDNIATSRVWMAAVTRHAKANTLAVINQAIKAVNPRPKGGKNDKGDKKPAPPSKKRPQAGADSSSDDTPVTMRCTSQDAPGGCTWGAKCKYEHDASNPKTDAGKKAPRDKKVQKTGGVDA
jgi:hypothetical protein